MARVKKRIEGIKKGQGSSNPDRAVKNASMRSRGTINRLNMYKSGGRAIRNRDGKIVKPAEFQSQLKSGAVARVEPNRKWFGNTRVIGQEALQKFQKELGNAVKDPFKVVLRTSKLPLSLLDAKPMAGKEKVHILDTEPYSEVFSKNRRRKRPNLSFESLEQVVEKVTEKEENYDMEGDQDLVRESDGTFDHQRNPLLNAGQSKRIWGELYRVLDSSDVIIQVLDARDPQGTRCHHIERYLEKEKPHKHLVFLLNKVDLQPIAVTRKWVQLLTKERPTLAFHSSITNPFGKGALISLLRQFALLHKDKKSISVGFIGYPNVGKSSVINTMKKKKVCNVAPIPGETKVWQFVALTKRVFLIDCPGVVYSGQQHDETELVLRGVCRVENIEDPPSHVPEVLRRAEHVHLAKLYQITGWEKDETGIEFLEMIARKRGKLLKGGEPDVHSVAKSVLRDWQYGKIPYLTQPDPNYVTKEKIKEKERPESEADKKQREEISNKRKEIEAKLNVEQELDEIKEKNMDDPEEYGADEGESEAEEEEEDAHEDKEEIPQSSSGPVSEKDLIMAKLAKLRKANKMGILQRQDAVNRNAARKRKMEESVDLGKIAREADKEERKAAAQKKKLDEKFKDDEEEETLPGVGLPRPKVQKEGTAKERRAKERKEKDTKGENYYTKANVKNKNKDKKVQEEMKAKFKKGNKKGQMRK
ncbi:Oidioi.mRNA.OKI2018_I69.PAR.g10907.t1.cds [Oikopleura dioica]|uniref:Nucleolar GTP-binding protein 2 n=1 Tax=Oikopleura dioica TaxID=34765 RepID=A0ABN7RXG1_OIKDI|nr:Oidioi.mRNA.OKI2018_I69.PAR.g10907.t1.cds [Oikopleura dioica]